MANTSSKSIDKFKLDDLSSIGQILSTDNLLIERTSGSTATSYKVKGHELAQSMLLSCLDFTVGRSKSGQSASNMLSAWWKSPTNGSRTLIKKVDLRDGFLSAVKYGDDTHDLSLFFDSRDGLSPIVIELSSLFNVYKAGNGLSATTDISSTTFTVKNYSNLSSIQPENWTFTIQNGANVQTITKKVMIQS